MDSRLSGGCVRGAPVSGTAWDVFPTQTQPRRELGVGRGGGVEVPGLEPKTGQVSDPRRGGSPAPDQDGGGAGSHVFTSSIGGHPAGGEGCGSRSPTADGPELGGAHHPFPTPSAAATPAREARPPTAAAPSAAPAQQLSQVQTGHRAEGQPQARGRSSHHPVVITGNAVDPGSHHSQKPVSE